MPLETGERETALMISSPLVQAMSQLGRSRNEFAVALNVDPATVYRWQAGINRPQRRHQLRIAKELGMPEQIVAAWFADDEDQAA